MVLLDRREFSLLDEIERKFDLIVEAYSNDELVYGHHIGKINHVDLLYERSSSHFTDASHRITSTKAPFPTKYRYIFYVNVLETFNATRSKLDVPTANFCTRSNLRILILGHKYLRYLSMGENLKKNFGSPGTPVGYGDTGQKKQCS